MVFKISTTSYLNRIIAGTYKINSKEITENWTDASGISHNRLKRRKISGSVDMFFKSMTEFNSFIALIESVKTSSLSVPMTVTVNNLNQNKTIDAFISFEPVRDINGVNDDYIMRYTLKVEER